MGPALYIMAILGCGEGETACQQVQVVPVQYQSQAQCNAATEEQLIRHSDLAFPLVVAQCSRLGAQPASLTPGEVLRVPAGRLPQQAPARTQIASRN
jgi:hypothetical protein